MIKVLVSHIFAILIVFTLMELSSENMFPETFRGCYMWNMWLQEKPHKKGMVCTGKPIRDSDKGDTWKPDQWKTDGYCGTVTVGENRLWVACRNASWCYKTNGCAARRWDEWCFQQEYPQTFKYNCTISQAPLIYYNITVQKCCCKGNGCNKNLFWSKKTASGISASLPLLTILSVFLLI